MEIREAIRAVVDSRSLSVADTEAVFGQIMDGGATDAQIAAFIVALRMKGETVDEITGAARAMRSKAIPVVAASPDHLVDTCGTGGDESGTFNISTAAAFVAAGAGAHVAKHGNRSVSSRSGSADVLEALGVTVTVTPELMKKCLDEIGICFLFAPSLHRAMKYAIGPRKEVGVRTIFNILGPLTNPAAAPSQVVGVFGPDLTETIASVLNSLGARRAFVVHGEDRLDEVSLSAPTRVSEVDRGTVRSYTVRPSDFGLSEAPRDSVAGGDAAENAHIVEAVLRGEKGPRRDIVVLNAAFAIAAAGLVGSPRDGIARAEQSIDSGAARAKLVALKKATA